MEYTKKEYNAPVVEIVEFETQNVVLTSGSGGNF